MIKLRAKIGGKCSTNGREDKGPAHAGVWWKDLREMRSVGRAWRLWEDNIATYIKETDGYGVS
jgi:hypothetical protein